MADSSRCSVKRNLIDEASEGRSSTMGSSFLQDEEEIEGEQASEAKVHCSFNMKKVAEAFSCIGLEKQQIIQQMRMEGLLKLPQQQQFTPCLVNRQFSFWLMLQVDVVAREINLGIRGTIPLTAKDVNKVLGIPWKGTTIEPSEPGDIDRAKKVIKRQLLLKECDAFDLPTLRRVIEKNYPNSMNEDEKRAFAVAAVIYATSYFLAPKSRPAKINNEVLPYLVDFKNICDVNWSEYVLRVLLESCSKVQNDKCLGQASLTLDGCLLVLQIMYLDNLDYGGARTRQYILPRVVDFRYDVIRYMIQQDSNTNVTDEGLKFGRLELRHPFETIYTRGEKYRSVEDKMQQTTASVTGESEVGLMVDFLKYFIDNEKQNVRRQAAESVENACISMDKCLKNLIANYEGWFENRKRQKGDNLPDFEKHMEGNNYRASTNCTADEITNEKDDCFCPKPLEVIKGESWQGNAGGGSSIHVQPRGVTVTHANKEEGYRQQAAAVSTMGRSKRMAFKTAGGKRNKKFGKGISDEGAATKDRDMVDG